jgi:hypothetical protein
LSGYVICDPLRPLIERVLAGESTLIKQFLGVGNESDYQILLRVGHDLCHQSQLKEFLFRLFTLGKHPLPSNFQYALVN